MQTPEFPDTGELEQRFVRVIGDSDVYLTAIDLSGAASGRMTLKPGREYEIWVRAGHTYKFQSVGKSNGPVGVSWRAPDTVEEVLEVAAAGCDIDLRDRCPSDCLPADINELASNELSQGLASLFRIAPDDRFNGPNQKALNEYLQKFIGTPYEKQVWTRYREFAGVTSDGSPKIRKLAAQCGLSEWEFIAAKTLEELRRYVLANGIPQPDNEERKRPAHADDFRSVDWYGIPYTFTPTQAACVKVLWEHWDRNTPTVGEQTILEVAESACPRLINVFGHGKHPAWGEMIVSDSKGTFRLAPPK